MASDPLVECSFLIPMRRDPELSDGELRSTDAWNWLTDQMYGLFKAWTLSPGFYCGVWENPKTGKPISDELRRFIIALPVAKLDELKQLLAVACSIFCQQCIYLSAAGQVELIEALTDGSAESLRRPEEPRMATGRA